MWSLAHSKFLSIVPKGPESCSPVQHTTGTGSVRSRLARRTVLSHGYDESRGSWSDYRVRCDSNGYLRSGPQRPPEDNAKPTFDLCWPCDSRHAAEHWLRKIDLFRSLVSSDLPARILPRASDSTAHKGNMRLIRVAAELQDSQAPVL
jgi:hypothetical protein